MSRTPAAELARVKVKYPTWSIRRVESGQGFTAHHGDDKLHGKTIADLELAVERFLSGWRPGSREWS